MHSMRTYEVKVYQVPKGAKPGVRPALVDTIALRASTIDGARDEAKATLVERGFEVRSINFTANGGMTAMVYRAD